MGCQYANGIQTQKSTLFFTCKRINLNLFAFLKDYSLLYSFDPLIEQFMYFFFQMVHRVDFALSQCSV